MAAGGSGAQTSVDPLDMLDRGRPGPGQAGIGDDSHRRAEARHHQGVSIPERDHTGGGDNHGEDDGDQEQTLANAGDGIGGSHFWLPGGRS